MVDKPQPSKPVWRQRRRKIQRPKYVPFTVRYARYLWRYKLTPAGRFLFWSVLFTSAGMATVDIPVYQLFCALFSTYLVVWLTNLLYRPKLNVKGDLPGRVTAGELITTEIQLTNESWRPAYDLMLWLIGLQKSIQLESAFTANSQTGSWTDSRAAARTSPDAARRLQAALPQAAQHFSVQPDAERRDSVSAQAINRDTAVSRSAVNRCPSRSALPARRRRTQF